MEKEAPFMFSPFAGLIEAEFCDECGEALDRRAVAIYDGEDWRTVHAACKRTE